MVTDGKNLSERKKMILKAIIDAHIMNGEPIGSKYLTQTNKIALSSATIRNEMAELEALGYLEQPHTSAGRVPSETGYRFYVDSLMKSYRLTAAELEEINNLQRNKVAEMDQLLERAGRIMSMLTNYTSLAVKPRPRISLITKFKAIYCEDHSFVLVMITDTDTVKTKYINVTKAVEKEALTRLENVLNKYVAGRPADSISLPIIMQMEAEMGEHESLVSPIIKTIYNAVNEGGEGDIKIEGVNRLLQYPEFSDLDMLREFLSVLEKKEDILDLISNSKKDVVNIFIGSENSVDVMHNSSLIFKLITSDNRVIGAIGVIGPRRMDYSKTVGTIEYLSEYISGLTGGNRALPKAKEDDDA